MAENPLGLEWKASRELGSNLLHSTTDRLGRSTSYQYDTQGNVTQTTRPDGSTFQRVVV